MVIYRGHWRPIAISQIFALLYVAFMIFIPMQVMFIINNYRSYATARSNRKIFIFIEFYILLWQNQFS